jgi:hypothetical protein
MFLKIQRKTYSSYNQISGNRCKTFRTKIFLTFLGRPIKILHDYMVTEVVSLGAHHGGLLAATTFLYDTKHFVFFKIK